MTDEELYQWAKRVPPVGDFKLLMNDQKPEWHKSTGFVVSGGLKKAQRLAVKLHATFIVSRLSGRIRTVKP